jgi:pimeloyl-ACP methyl ester carboxylesterase
MATRTITTPNVTFEAFDEGRGPLVLCLHGFPDQAGSFRHQIPALVGAGYRVVAPHMRGYRPTSAPNDGRFDAMALAETSSPCWTHSKPRPRSSSATTGARSRHFSSRPRGSRRS